MPSVSPEFMLPLETSADLSQHTRPTVLIGTRVLGAPGQPWLTRQLQGMDQINSVVLCWQHIRGLHTSPLCVEDGAGHPSPYDGPQRWRLRLKNCLHGNYYAAAGDDRASIASTIARHHPTAVLAYFGDIAMRMLPAAERADIPVIAYLHGDFLFRTNRWYRWSFCRCVDRFAAVVVVTEEERSWLVSHGVPAKRIHLVPCGAPAHTFSLHPGLNRHHEVVMASRLVDEKGCAYSIEAFARAAQAHPGWTLQVFGDGPARVGLAALAERLGVCSRVTFHGYVGEDAMAAALARASIFVQHSLRKEGSPVSIAEAMLSGLPVVATPVGGIVDQVIHDVTGLLIPERDVGAMARSIDSLMKNEALRRQLGHAGAQLATVDLNAERQTAKLQRIVLEVAQSQVSTRQYASTQV